MEGDVGIAIRDWIAEEALAGRPDVALDDRTELLKHGYLDSLLLLRLVAFIESRFGVEVPDEDVIPVHFRNIGTMTTLINRLQHQQKTMGA